MARMGHLPKSDTLAADTFNRVVLKARRMRRTDLPRRVILLEVPVLVRAVRLKESASDRVPHRGRYLPPDGASGPVAAGLAVSAGDAELQQPAAQK